MSKREKLLPIPFLALGAHIGYGLLNLYWFIFTGDTLYHPTEAQVSMIVVSGLLWSAVCMAWSISAEIERDKRNRRLGG